MKTDPCNKMLELRLYSKFEKLIALEIERMLLNHLLCGFKYLTSCVMSHFMFLAKLRAFFEIFIWLAVFLQKLTLSYS
jgi:hypothetical protein